MKLDKLKEILDDCCNDIAFSYNGKASGIIPEVKNYDRTYHMWYGDKTKDYDDIEILLQDRVFDDLSLKDIIEIIDISIS